jgi:hypothetical protein
VAGSEIKWGPDKTKTLPSLFTFGIKETYNHKKKRWFESYLL